MDAFEALSPEDLDRKLRERDDFVCPRGQGRTTGQAETWVACRMLATLAKTGLLQFPLRVEHKDRPDFVVSLPDDQKIGIELVEAISTDQGRVEARIELNIASDPNWSDFPLIPRYQISDQQRSKAEIPKLAKGKFQKFPFMPEPSKRRWLDAMTYFVARKGKSFHKSGFAKYPSNWLQIYDNWGPVSVLDESTAPGSLSRKLLNDGWNSPFDRIFVQRPRLIWEFSKHHPEFIEHLIPDHWLSEGQDWNT